MNCKSSEKNFSLQCTVYAPLRGGLGALQQDRRRFSTKPHMSRLADAGRVLCD